MSVTLTQAWGPTPLVLAQKPTRIVSLVPSVTETMLHWGGQLVGRSSFCIMPTPQVDGIVRVGGTKTPNHKRILALTPDLVIANLEENQKADIEALQDKGIPVWITYPEDMPSTMTYLHQLRQLCPVESKRAENELSQFDHFIDEVSKHISHHRVAVMIWKDPWMLVGQQTYTHHLLAASGLENAVDTPRYPVMTEDQLSQLDIDILLLPSEPYAFTADDQAAWQKRFSDVGKATRVALFNGENLFWSGPRAMQAVKDLRALFLEPKGGACDNACV